MRSEFIISDFKNAVKEKEHLSETCSKDLWEVVSYETAEISGNLLVASQESFPKPVTVEPKLEGWYKIYVCMTYTDGKGWGNHLNLKLTDDEFSTNLQPGDTGAYCIWKRDEQVEESLWKMANMTGQSITISKVDFGNPHTASICWLRFVEMTKDEVAAFQKEISDTSSKTMLAHMDTDFDMFDISKEPHEYCRALYCMKDSDVKIVSQEITNDFMAYDTLFPEQFVGRSKWQMTRAHSFVQFYKWRNEIYKEEIAYAHRHNMELYAAHRMSLSNFTYPIESPLLREEFVHTSPRYRCEARDGRKVEFLSYAYKEVQDYRIANLKYACRQGFDGVHLLFFRGIHIAFEEPVVARFRAKFGDSIDCRRLPMTDSRLYGIWCDILMEFMMRLRQELNDCASEIGREPMKIYVTTLFTVRDSLYSGLDVERWAREGLVDGIVQGKMAIWEEIEDVLSEDSLIDIEKYARKAETQYVVKREFGDMRRMIAGIPEYRKIADQYGVKFYSETQWEGGVSPVEFIQDAKNIYEAGGQYIALWDCYPYRTSYQPEWQCNARFGSLEHVYRLSSNLEDYAKYHKVLSYNGKDMRYYHPSWRG